MSGVDAFHKKVDQSLRARKEGTPDSKSSLHSMRVDFAEYKARFAEVQHDIHLKQARLDETSAALTSISKGEMLGPLKTTADGRFPGISGR